MNADAIKLIYGVNVMKVIKILNKVPGKRFVVIRLQEEIVADVVLPDVVWRS